ncbi:MAG: response regulator [Desulfosarcinaceae bacterium]|jgi:two-component system, chemotaxis family, response regulator Rcp1
MNQKIRILLVEDNPADADLTCEKLEQSKILHEISTVKDGVEAMDYLFKRDSFENAVRPDLVLLDLNLPRKDGREVLAEMKASADLRRIPVVVLTSSQAEEDIIKTYDLQASAYVTKPVDLAGFGEIVKAIEGFWFSVVRFPPGD